MSSERRQVGCHEYVMLRSVSMKLPFAGFGETPDEVAICPSRADDGGDNNGEGAVAAVLGVLILGDII
jgi:hypothetical protein